MSQDHAEQQPRAVAPKGLDNFLVLYNLELVKVEEDGNDLKWAILNRPEFRAFVYEVCKNVVREEKNHD